MNAPNSCRARPSSNIRVRDGGFKAWIVADIPIPFFAGHSGLSVQLDDAHVAQSFRTATKRSVSPSVPIVIRSLVPFGFRSSGNQHQKLTSAFKLESGPGTMAPKSKTKTRDEKATNTGESALLRVMKKSQQSQHEFDGVEPQSGKASDQRTVETDVLQILAYIEFDYR